MTWAQAKRLAKKPCPSCGSREVWPIAYGMPTGPMMRTVLGGCITSDDDPLAECQGCSVLIWSDGRTSPPESDPRFIGS